MIDWLRMTNWRAYDQFEVNLYPGINLIMGPNGAGKTSILEAISFALCGEAGTVNQKGRLTRTPGSDTVVELHLRQNDQVYRIERSIRDGRASQASLSNSGGKTIARSQAGVTAAVEKLFNTQADFFRRLVYMAEGDVFRFLNDAPGQAVNTQIASVIGLVHLEQFGRGIIQARRSLKARLDALTRLRAAVNELRLKPVLPTAGDPLAVETLCQELQQKLDSLVAEQQATYERQRRLDSLQRRWQSAVERFQQAGILGENASGQMLADLSGEVGTWQEIAEGDLHALHVTIGENKGAIDTLRQTITLLSGSLDSRCPVCSHPLASSERNVILEQLQTQLARRTSEQQQRIAEAERQQEALIATRPAWQALQSIATELENPGSETLISFQATCQNALSEIARLETACQETRAELADLQKHMAAYLATQQHMEAEGFSHEQDVQEALIALQRRLLLLDAAEAAVMATQVQQRDRALTGVYTQVAQLWQSFLGRSGDWQIKLGDDGSPQLTDLAQERSFDLSQFSGGQKTAFMVMLHTVLAHHFSQARFLLVDEPLEHLDPVNRRSLVRFLLNAYRQGLFEQLIVTTFEESLVRQYATEEGVHLIYVEPPIVN